LGVFASKLRANFLTNKLTHTDKISIGGFKMSQKQWEPCEPLEPFFQKCPKHEGEMNAIEIAREVFPDKPDDFLEFVIWEYTGFPSFWNIPQEGNTPEECFRKQLNDFKKG